MATITGRTLSVVNLDDTRVTLTVSYTLTPSNIERLAGSVFSEDIRLIGNDPGVADDIVITIFPAAVFAVGDAVNVARTRSRNVLKSALNEDPAFAATGAELSDEVFARITITYAANAPAVPTLPAPGSTNQVTGAWK